MLFNLAYTQPQCLSKGEHHAAQTIRMENVDP